MSLYRTVATAAGYCRVAASDAASVLDCIAATAHKNGKAPTVPAVHNGPACSFVFFLVAVVVDVVVACCAAVATAVAAVARFLYAFVPGIANDS